MSAIASSLRDPRIAAGVVTIAVFAMSVFALYPGWYSFDSAYQLHQARTGNFVDLQPPGMAIAWAGLLAFGLPPGALLVAHLTALTGGAMLAGLSLRRPLGLAFPLILFWPPLLAVFGHLWTDVSLAAALMLATGWIAWTRATGRTRLSWWAAIPLAYAVGMRHNAVFAIPPLLFLLVAGPPSRPRGMLSTLASVVLLTVGTYGAWAIVSRVATQVSVPAWTLTALWDLSAASVASGEMLLPAGVRGPNLTVEELRPLVNPHTSVSVLHGTRSGVNTGILEPPLPQEVRRELLVRWVSLPFTHGNAWLHHRVGVAWSLFGPQPASKVESQFIEPHVHAFGDNPAIPRNETLLNAMLLRATLAMQGTLWCTPLFYLLLSLVAVLLALRPGFSGDRMLVIALACSAWLFALSFALLAPAADWRYMLWPTMAALVALPLVVDSRGPRWSQIP